MGRGVWPVTYAADNKETIFLLHVSEQTRKTAYVLALSARITGDVPPATCHRKVRMEKPGYRGRNQIHIWTQGRVEEKIQTGQSQVLRTSQSTTALTSHGTEKT